jgi:site-specific DNA recombinase
MKAIAYIRVSTAEQADEGVSIDAQRSRIRAWCEANGYRLADVFTDAGLSGKRADNRRGLQDALQTVCKARGAALVVHSLSRLARSTKDAIGIAERLDKAGADLVSLSERIDTTSAAGRMIFRMLAVFAEFERDLISERIKSALDHKRSSGQRVGAVLYGFDLADDGKTLIPNEAEQAVLADIRALRNSGKTLKAIAKALTDRGIPTKTGKSPRWTHQTVARILKRSLSAQGSASVPACR